MKAIWEQYRRSEYVEREDIREAWENGWRDAVSTAGYFPAGDDSPLDRAYIDGHRAATETMIDTYNQAL